MWSRPAPATWPKASPGWRVSSVSRRPSSSPTTRRRRSSQPSSEWVDASCGCRGRRGGPRSTRIARLRSPISRASRDLCVHPIQDDPVKAGNGTIGLEVAEQLEDIDAVIIPWGGGGLTTGVASALKAVSPTTKVYVCEPETGAPVAAAIANGGVRRRSSSRLRSSTGRARGRFSWTCGTARATWSRMRFRSRSRRRPRPSSSSWSGVASWRRERQGSPSPLRSRVQRARGESSASSPAGTSIRAASRRSWREGCRTREHVRRGGLPHRRARPTPRWFGEEPARHRPSARVPPDRPDLDRRAAAVPGTVEPARAVRPGRTRPAVLEAEEAVRVERLRQADRGSSDRPGAHSRRRNTTRGSGAAPSSCSRTRGTSGSS